MALEIQKDGFTISTDPSRLDANAIYCVLSQTYWAKNRSREVMDKAIAGSLCFGVYEGQRQIGFARAVTDKATVGYLADVYILEPYRRRGLARWLVETILSHPDLKGLRRWVLLTRDMHELYRKCGFSAPASPQDYMERVQAYPTASQSDCI